MDWWTWTWWETAVVVLLGIIAINTFAKTTEETVATYGLIIRAVGALLLLGILWKGRW